MESPFLTFSIMKTSMITKLSGLTGIAIAMGLSSVQAHGPTEQMAKTANRFLDSLSQKQREQATFPMKSDERANWHYFPKEREGVSLKEMGADQRQLAQALLSSALSHEGYVKALTIMSLEQILYDLEGGNDSRDPELYYVTIFGDPKPDGTWGWRVEGHHLSVNFTIVEGDHIATTPSFYGANPARVLSGPQKGLRTLKAEEDLARKLVKSLSANQRDAAIFSKEPPHEILTGADRKAHGLKPLGLAREELTQRQQKVLDKLIREYVYRYRTEIAKQAMKEIKRSESIHFAWAGGLEAREPHYYRIQGSAFLMEYANTQNSANHIHAVWRDLQNDFGRDLLKRHYEEHHSD